MFDKMKEVVEQANAFGIKKDALQEMREMENSRNENFFSAVKQLTDTMKDMMLTKMELLNERVMSYEEMFMEKMRIERNEHTGIIKQLLRSDKVKLSIEEKPTKQNNYVSKIGERLREKPEVAPIKSRFLKKNISKKIGRDPRNNDILDSLEADTNSESKSDETESDMF